jgi:hypothetical protein
MPEVFRQGTSYAFISLTDVRGSIPLELRLVDLSDNEVLLRTTLSVSSDDPLKTVEAIVAVPPLPVLHPGVYALELLSDEELLGALRIAAVAMAEP